MFSCIGCDYFLDVSDGKFTSAICRKHNKMLTKYKNMYGIYIPCEQCKQESVEEFKEGEKTMEQIIKIKLGDKVIRADGLAGKVIEVAEIYYGQGTADIALIKYEDGTRGGIHDSDIENGYKDYYLIGTTILGNKRPLEELDDRIADTHQEIEHLKAQEKQLRKQRWRLEYQMNPELYKPQNGDKKD